MFLPELTRETLDDLLETSKEQRTVTRLLQVQSREMTQCVSIIVAFHCNSGLGVYQVRKRILKEKRSKVTYLLTTLVMS